MDGSLPRKNEAIVGYYQVLNGVNQGFRRLMLAGLDPDKQYCINGVQERVHYGDELMSAGLVIRQDELCTEGAADFTSVLYVLKRI